MKKFFFVICISLLVSCGGNHAPDVSDIKVDLSVKRFERDFFALDTSHLSQSLTDLQNQYPKFLPDYFHNILGLPYDSAGNNNPEVLMAITRFIDDYSAVKDSAEKIFKNFDKWEQQIRRGLQYVKYYFPAYKADQTVITFIGPFDAFFATSYGIQGDVLTSEGPGVGLQLHLGKNFSFYKSPAGQELYPAYISENFDPAHIVINCMRNIVDDLFAPQRRPSSLIEEMVSAGRRYFLLTRFLPDVPDALLFGYTPLQMKGAKKNEAVIWDFFLNNDLLNITDQNIIKNYVGPGPKTQEFGEGSPGDIGSFAGLQIVRKYMEKFPETKLQELMTLPPRQIYDQSRYKPKL